MTTAITTRAGKGSELTWNEMDTNLENLRATADGTVTALAASGGAGLVGFIQAGTGAVARTAQGKMRERITPQDFGAIGDGVANDTAAIQTWIAAIPSGSKGYVPAGIYAIDPITISKNILLVGQSTRSGTIASRFIARGNQTHIIKFKGVGYPDALFGWGVEKISLFGGTTFTISDAALIIQDATMGNFLDFVITNVTGTAIRFNNAMDLHFLRPVIADCGSNADKKPVIVYDPSSSFNCNNIYWVDPHFESLAYTIMTGSGATDDQIQIVGGKNENRLLCNGITSTDLAFPLFDVDCGRFSCHNLTMTNIHNFTSPTFKIYGITPQITGIQVQNGNQQTGDFISISADAVGYIVKNNGGYNISNTNDGSGITNISTKHGQAEPVWWANNSKLTNRRAILDSVAPPIEHMTSSAGGDYVYGSTGSLLGKSISFTTSSDLIAAIQLPIGYGNGVRISWRVKSSNAAATLALSFRTKSGSNSVVRSSVAVTTSFTIITMVLTPTQLQTAFEAIIYKDSVDAHTITVDGAWIEYSDGAISDQYVICSTSTPTNLGEISNVSFFYVRHNYGCAGLIAVDINQGVTIVYQGAAGFFTLSAPTPASNEIQLTQVSGQLKGLAASAGRGIVYKQTVVI